uniref:Sulfotransferase domain-containing protein n=1 Tax=Candidatus Kentrum sp. DK TaxID=2126562 RepID=A0A450T0F5_9GAMM|nr:MAG: hypothetical protein BECKDK2373B_GA0170837_108812 [Candidatus Kentron sp. DK]
MQHLYLHIGTNKTATSLIQAACRHQRGLLQQSGIDYPATGLGQSPNGSVSVGHHDLAAAISPSQVRNFRASQSIESLRDALLRETAHYPKVLLSSETLSYIGHRDMPRLRVLLDAFPKVTVIAYIRRQDSFALSGYNQKIKSAYNQNKFPKSLPNFEPYCKKTKMDFYRKMRFWDQHGGNAELVVRPFVETAWKEGNILADLFAIIDPDMAPPRSDKAQRNESWPLAAIHILQRLDAMDIPHKDRRELARVIRQVAERFSVRPDEGFLTPDIQRYLLERYRKSNRLLATRFWTREETHLFEEQEVKTYPKSYSGITAGEYAEIIAAVWKNGIPVSESRISSAVGHNPARPEWEGSMWRL